MACRKSIWSTVEDVNIEMFLDRVHIIRCVYTHTCTICYSWLCRQAGINTVYVVWQLGGATSGIGDTRNKLQIHKCLRRIYTSWTWGDYVGRYAIIYLCCLLINMLSFKVIFRHFVFATEGAFYLLSLCIYPKETSYYMKVCMMF